jgi:hypothetical protein
MTILSGKQSYAIELENGQNLRRIIELASLAEMDDLHISMGAVPTADTMFYNEWQAMDYMNTCIVDKSTVQSLWD